MSDRLHLVHARQLWWKERAFVRDRPCNVCGRWTRSGYRVVGQLRYHRMCKDCMQNRCAYPIYVEDELKP